ncbi:MAG: hypothetical protein AAF614_41270 [Chloroflexota bacterium]
MSENQEQSILRPPLPPRAAAIVDSFEGAHLRGKPKGASRTVRLICQVFGIIAEEFETDDAEVLIEHINSVADYFMATRGKMTPAIPNGIHTVLAGLDKNATSVSQIQNFVMERTQQFIARSEQNVQQIFEVGANLLADQMTVLAYDYSSTVVGVIRRAGKMGKKLNLIIPESRSLNGGLPIVKTAVEAGHQVLYTTDQAIGQQLARAEAALIGVESITAAGGCWNTTGSLMVAVLAHYHNVPLYAPTELSKFDFRSLSGHMREVKWFELPAISGNDPILQHEAVRIQCQDLDYVPPQFITAFLTEKGVLSAQNAVVAAQAARA